MAEYYVKSGGQTYGPYSQQQYQSLVSSGRVSPTTEVSTDNATWTTASALQGGAARPARPAGGDTRSYLGKLRGRTNYPICRAVVMIFAILGFIGAALPTVVHVVMVIRMGLDEYFQVIKGQEWLVVAPFFLSAIIAVGVKFYQEFATMLIDIADSTIDYHSRS